jgi:hypothetical protein
VTVEAALQLNIDTLVRAGAIQPGACVGGEMKLKFYDDELATIQFE